MSRAPSCRTCKFAKRRWSAFPWEWRFATCTNPATFDEPDSSDYKMGLARSLGHALPLAPHPRSCSLIRAFSHISCGPTGSLWEPRRNIWYRARPTGGGA